MRALRVLFVANDGLSVGHVTRTLAIARALARRAAQRDLEIRPLLATTSEAHALLADEPIAIVRLPSPGAARRAGFSDAERRRVVRGAIEGTMASFSPDLVVADTFPAGPHGELAGLLDGAKRALVRRAIPDERASDEALIHGLGDYDLTIVADDPGAHTAPAATAKVVRVPPITSIEASDCLSRDEARAALGLPASGRIILVASGGGGDEAAVAQARAIAETIAGASTTAALAVGPLASGQLAEAEAGAPIHLLTRARLAPLLRAFDGAIAPAGYNTAHELAVAGVPAALFARPRPFDDQAGRAARFAAAGLACVLDESNLVASLAAAGEWMASAALAPRPPFRGGGADRAAVALLDLMAPAGHAADR